MPNWESFDAFLKEAQQAETDDQRRDLVNQLLLQRPHWPWVSKTHATFIYTGEAVENAALNLDTIKSDPPFDPMTRLEGTSLWYVTREFAPDDLLDYMLAINDPQTPLATETNLLARVKNHWQSDPKNPLKMQTAQVNVSVLKMPQARPFPDWAAFDVSRGQVHQHELESQKLGFTGRKLAVYTPPGYNASPDTYYPLLILQDSQWSTGPLQIPHIADTLIRHGHLQPLLIAMIQSGPQEARPQEFINNDNYFLFHLTELLPLVQSHYRVDASLLGLGGVGIGAIASIHSALMNPGTFSRLIMISPPLGKGPHQDQLREYIKRFQAADSLPSRIFQSVGRYETPARFVKPARELRDILRPRLDTEYRYVEIGAGHGLVAFKAIFPEALSWVFPGTTVG